MIYGWLIAEQTPNIVNVEIVLENWSLVVTPRKAIYGQISAASLALLVEEHGKTLFERNIRHYLGSVGVNTAIEETVRRRPDDFFYLNNGVTAVAETITPALGTPVRCNFALSNFSIVNGAQTSGAIANAALAGSVSAAAKILITVIEIGKSPDDIGRKITQARNHQNQVRDVHFAALDPNQERLRKELAVVGVTYHYRPSAEARVRKEDAFTLEEASVALACLSFKVCSSAKIQDAKSRGAKIQNAVDFVVTAKREIGRLWEPESILYNQIFDRTLSGVQMYRLFQIYRLTDATLADTERSQDVYYRRTIFSRAATGIK